MTTINLNAHVQISAQRGGYVVVTDEYDPVTGTWEQYTRVCASIREVVIHSIRALESADQFKPSEYERIEEALNR